MHLKRLGASKSYNIPKKTAKFAVLPSSGAHAKGECIPVGVFLRDILMLAKTLSEAKTILNNGYLLVDGKIIKNYKHPVGFMDVVALPKIKKYYRILSKSGKLVPVEIDSKESLFKLGKIISKKQLNGGKMQFGLHDGRTFVMAAKKAIYKVGDTVQISVPTQEVKAHVSMDIGNIVMVTGGRHVGSIGKLKKLEIVESPEPNMVIVDIDGKELRTLKDYIFVIGTKTSLIKLE
ncbi:MAG: 30S ribosomal protein S4e [Nanohaloarchaea archaeon]|nr:30S ribosomal protein S4e [Candidatus Nanohaloarchaea archaeon]